MLLHPDAHHGRGGGQAGGSVTLPGPPMQRVSSWSQDAHILAGKPLPLSHSTPFAVTRTQLLPIHSPIPVLSQTQSHTQLQTGPRSPCTTLNSDASAQSTHASHTFRRPGDLVPGLGWGCSEMGSALFEVFLSLVLKHEDWNPLRRVGKGKNWGFWCFSPRGTFSPSHCFKTRILAV